MNKKKSCVLRNVWLFLLVQIFFRNEFFSPSFFWLRNERKNSRYLCFWKCDENFWFLIFETEIKCYLNQIQRIFCFWYWLHFTSAWVQTTENWENRVNTFACMPRRIQHTHTHTVHLNWNTNSLGMNVDCFFPHLYEWNICDFYFQTQWHTKFSTIICLEVVVQCDVVSESLYRYFFSCYFENHPTKNTIWKAFCVRFNCKLQLSIVFHSIYFSLIAISYFFSTVNMNDLITFKGTIFLRGKRKQIT